MAATKPISTARLAQMDAHGVNRSRFPFASFCGGRGWKGHATAEAARRAASRDARIQRQYGCYPNHLVARTDTGETV